MCTGRDLVASVARARLQYAKRFVSGGVLGTCRDVRVRAVHACGVRGCGVGARREPGERHGCVEVVHSAAGRRRTLVGSRLNQRGPTWSLYGRACGRLGDSVSSRSAGSDMRRRLGWCGVRWLFRGFCSGGNLERSAAAVWGKSGLWKCY